MPPPLQESEFPERLTEGLAPPLPLPLPSPLPLPAPPLPAAHLMLDTLCCGAPTATNVKTFAMGQLIESMSQIMSDFYAFGRPADDASYLFYRITHYAPVFVEFLKMNNFPQLQSASASLLASIAAVDPEIVIQLDALPIFLKLIVPTQDQVREQALLALGNLAPQCSDAPPPPPLIRFVSSLTGKEDCPILRNAVWALANFCRETPSLDVLPALKLLIHSSDEHVLDDVCWTLSHISNITDCATLSDILPTLVKLLDHSSPLVIISALRTVGNIVARSQTHTQIIIDLGALSRLQNLLIGDYSQSIKKVACWTLSNIIVENLEAVLGADIIRWLAFIIIGNVIFDEMPNSVVKQEAIWAIANAAFVASSDQIHQLVLEHCVRALSWVLLSPHPATTDACLEALHDMAERDNQDWVIQNLELHNGFFYIMCLRETHEDPHIRLKAKSFMDLYWKDRLKDYDYAREDETNSRLERWRERGKKRSHPSPCPFPIVEMEMLKPGVDVRIFFKGLRVLNIYFDETRPINRFSNCEKTSSIKRVKVRYYHGTLEHKGESMAGTGVVKDLFDTKKGKVIQTDFNNKANYDIENYLLELGIDVGGDYIVKKLWKLFELFRNPDRLACLDIYDFESKLVPDEDSRIEKTSPEFESLFQSLFAEK